MTSGDTIKLISLAQQQSWGWNPIFLVWIPGARESRLELVVKELGLPVLTCLVKTWKTNTECSELSHTGKNDYMESIYWKHAKTNEPVAATGAKDISWSKQQICHKNVWEEKLGSEMLWGFEKFPYIPGNLDNTHISRTRYMFKKMQKDPKLSLLEDQVLHQQDMRVRKDL